MQGHIDAWCIPSRTTGVPGIETYAEEGALIELALKVPEGGVIVELGGEYGRSASQFAYALKLNGHQSAWVCTVDLFPSNHWYVGDLLDAWESNLEECKLDSFCTPLRGNTIEAAKVWRDLKEAAPIDLLFIDAGHSYNEVKADIENWIPFVKSGGVVAFHDYAKTPDAHPLHFEVKQAVDSWHVANPTWLRNEGVDSLVWFTKPNPPKIEVIAIATLDYPMPPPLPSTIDNLPPTVKNKGGRPKGSGTKAKAAKVE